MEIAVIPSKILFKMARAPSAATEIIFVNEIKFFLEKIPKNIK